ncbi:hypothetical protein ALC62_07141, partial [Cyphomyrmex costatus]
TYEKREGRSVIDFGIVNWKAWERVERFEVGCRGESDHQPIMIELGSYYERGKEKREEEQRFQDWSEEGTREYRKAIEEIERRGGGVKERWEELEREINKAVEFKKRRKRGGMGWCSWWDGECREKKRKMNRARRPMNECGENKWELLRERDIEVDEQERGEKVRASKSCASYRKVIGVPIYIRMCKRNEGKRLVKIARWRCGNEERGNKYWMKEEERKCRLCERERENVEHLKNRCEYVGEKGERDVDVLDEDGRLEESNGWR